MELGLTEKESHSDDCGSDQDDGRYPQAEGDKPTIDQIRANLQGVPAETSRKQLNVSAPSLLRHSHRYATIAFPPR